MPPSPVNLDICNSLLRLILFLGSEKITKLEKLKSKMRNAKQDDEEYYLFTSLLNTLQLYADIKIEL